MDLDLWDFLGRVKLIAKFHRTDLVICSHSREGKTPSYSRINMANFSLVFALGLFKVLYFLRTVSARAMKLG